MRIKQFHNFSESAKYSDIRKLGIIYYLYQWKNLVNHLDDDLPEEVDKFFGEGTWEKCRKKATNLIQKMKGIDIGEVYDRLEDLNDLDEFGRYEVYVGFLGRDGESGEFKPTDPNSILWDSFVKSVFFSQDDFRDGDFLDTVTTELILGLWECVPRWKREGWDQDREVEKRKTGLPPENRPIDHRHDVDGWINSIHLGVLIRIDGASKDGRWWGAGGYACGHAPFRKFAMDELSKLLPPIISSLGALGSVTKNYSGWEWMERFRLKIVLPK